MSIQTLYALRRLKTSQYICALREGRDYVIGFSELNAASEFRAELGEEEFAEICSIDILDFPSQSYWIDGRFVEIDTDGSVKGLGLTDESAC